MNKEEVIRAIHYLLSDLHLMLATNKMSHPESLELAERIVEAYKKDVFHS